jgi:hypothetical protein
MESKAMNKLLKSQIQINKEQARLIRAQRRQVEVQTEINQKDAALRKGETMADMMKGIHK